MKVGENELLELLNSAPIVDGELVETLDDPGWRELRDDLRSVIRGESRPESLQRYLEGVMQHPRVDNGGISWTLEAPESTVPYALYVLAWSTVEMELPGRLRACANDECSKFLIDHSKPNSARWCSMAECGNRMKTRRHHARQLSAAADGRG